MMVPEILLVTTPKCIPIFVDNPTITAVSLNGTALTLNTDYSSTGTEVTIVNIPTGDTITLTGAIIGYTSDFITDVQQQVVWQFSDDNGTFDPTEGMLIKLESGYDTSITGKTYLVTGIGNLIQNERVS